MIIQNDYYIFQNAEIIREQILTTLKKKTQKKQIKKQDICKTGFSI